MNDTARIFVLPVSDGRPQLFLDAGQLLRETDPARLTGNATAETIRQNTVSYLAKIMAQVDKGVAIKATADQFRGVFKTLYNNLITGDVHDQLRDLRRNTPAERAPLLRLYTAGGAEWIPWEMLHDENDYLGLQFQIARLPIVRQKTEAGEPPKTRTVESVCNLLAKQILDAPLEQAWQQTFANGYSNQPNWESRYPDAAGANYPTNSTISNARDVADIIHITCHGGVQSRANDEELCWTLDHQNVEWFDYEITADTVQGLGFKKKPLVFANACASDATKDSGRGVISGYGANFLIGGALNFIGTFAPITKTMGVNFAAKFYHELFSNPAPTVAEALWRTKTAIRAADGGDPSYLFYCLYGPPEVKYQAVP